MDDTEEKTRLVTERGKSHMPQNSVFFEKIVPILLTVIGIVMAGLVLFAIGVLTGLIKF